METNDITVEILRDIRDAVRETNVRVDGVSARVDETNARLDQTNARLDQTNVRITEGEMRMSTAVFALKGSIDDVKHLLADRLDLRDRVDRCEREIDVIKTRLAR